MISALALSSAWGAVAIAQVLSRSFAPVKSGLLKSTLQARVSIHIHIGPRAKHN